MATALTSVLSDPLLCHQDARAVSSRGLSPLGELQCPRPVWFGHGSRDRLCWHWKQGMLLQIFRMAGFGGSL